MRFFFSDVLTYCVMLQAFICYFFSSDVFDARARVCVCVCARAQKHLTKKRARAHMYVCVCFVHWHCTAQLSMFNMEKCCRNKIIIIIDCSIIGSQVPSVPAASLIL